MQHRGWVALFLGLSVWLPGAAQGDDMAAAARQVVAANQDAVVTVRLILKQTYSSPGAATEEMEEKMEVTGTVLDPTGLTAVSMVATDPSSLYADMMGDEDEGFKMESQVTDVKLLMSDGAELPASIVLRDKDLDLALIRLKTPPEKPMAYVDFSKPSKVEQFDPVAILGRLGKVAQRACAGAISRVTAVVSKPRAFYSLGGDSFQLGSPAFLLSGEAVGICVLRSMNVGEDSYSFFDFHGGDSSMLPVILPSSDILELAAQAKADGDTPKAENAVKE